MGEIIAALFCVGTIPGMEHLRFVRYILMCYLLLPYLLFIKNALMKYQSKNRMIIIVGLFTVPQLIGFSFNGYGMTPNRMSCFLVGVILSELVKNKVTYKCTSTVIYFTALIFNLIRFYGVHIIQIENNLIFALFTQYAHGLLGITIFLVLYGAFKNIGRNVVLQISDRYSYYIYLVHEVFILGPLTMMNLTSNITFNVIFICCCILASGILLEKVTININIFIQNITVLNDKELQ